MLGDAKLANCVNLSRRIPAVVQKQQMSWRSTTIELRPESDRGLWAAGFFKPTELVGPDTAVIEFLVFPR